MDALLSWWPVLFFILALFALAALWELARIYQRRRRLARAGIAEIDAMDGETFEMYLEGMFQRLGYEVERTRYRKDFGADLIISKGETRMAVQAKRSASKIGVSAVQQVVASRAYYKANATMVVTNHVYTRPAKTLAKVNEVMLWDREALIEAILASKQQAVLPAPVPASDSSGEQKRVLPTDSPAVSPEPGASLPSWLDGADTLTEAPPTPAPPRPGSLKGKGQRL